MRNAIFTSLLAGLLASGPARAETAASGELPLSPELRTFLQAEMRGIAEGVQAITVALATADWKTVATRAEAIRDAYLAHQRLPAARREELERLPEGFHALDGDFHDRADRLARAAEARDGELAAFHLYRLNETCIACHAGYAAKRFPGFEPRAVPRHEH